MADLSISLGIPSIELITQTSDKEGNMVDALVINVEKLRQNVMDMHH